MVDTVRTKKIIQSEIDYVQEELDELNGYMKEYEEMKNETPEWRAQVDEAKAEAVKLLDEAYKLFAEVKPEHYAQFDTIEKIGSEACDEFRSVMITLLVLIGRKGDVFTDHEAAGSIMLEYVQKKEGFLNQLKTVKDNIPSRDLNSF